MRITLVLFFIFSFSQISMALTAKDVVDSSLKHYPDVIQAILSVDQSKNNLNEAKGTFDAKIKGEVDSRTEGYYSGDAYKGQIEKTLPYLNTKIYSGYRQSYGSFPSYEGKLETLDRGEAFAGLSLSLVRDSLIDINRYNIRIKQQDYIQSQIEKEQVKLAVQTLALQAYWRWYVEGSKLQVYNNILKLAKKRDQQLYKRIKAGDLARIYRTENNQYIKKREAQTLQSEIEFQQASYYLSLFYRDSNGQPIPLIQFEPPHGQGAPLKRISNDQFLYNKALQNNLYLRKLNSQSLQAEADIQMGTNAILPKVDLNVEWNQDQGAGVSRLAGNENRVMLQVEIPIEYNKGVSKRRAGKAKLERIKSKKQLEKEKLRVGMQSLILKMNSFSKIFDVTTEQVNLAQKLANAELRKFSQGASDLILVNIREETLAEAQIKNLEALQKYYFTEAELRKMTLDFL